MQNRAKILQNPLWIVLSKCFEMVKIRHFKATYEKLLLFLKSIFADYAIKFKICEVLHLSLLIAINWY